jgi:hypothetical protein
MNMSPNIHAILSELHKLLSTYSAKDFRDARNYSGLSRPMRAALDALCRESLPKNKLEDQRHDRLDSNSVAVRRVTAGPLAFETKEDLFAAIQHSAFYGRINLLANYAREVGVKVQPRPKESKDKFARRLAAALLLLPEVRRAKAIADLKSVMKSQTEGWIDVIRSNS